MLWPRRFSTAYDKLMAPGVRRTLLLLAACSSMTAASNIMRLATTRTVQQGNALDTEALPAFLKAGPYDVQVTEAALTVPAPNPCNLRLRLSSPFGAPAGSVPVVLMFNGFQMQAQFYAVYARALATWGYAALQYDLPGSPLRQIVRDDIEIQFIPYLLSWLEAASRDPARAVYQQLDLRRVAAMGHSRGAKLAALALAGRVGGVSQAVMVDPVDMTSQTRRSGYPSAVEALARSPHPALVIGAGLSGRCNPAAEGWAKFWPVMPQGSWLHEVVPAGHMQFCDIKGLAAWTFDKLCGAGSTITHKTAIHLAQGASIAWLQSAFRPQESTAALAEYLQWLQARAGLSQLIQFSTKTTAAVSTPSLAQPACVVVRVHAKQPAEQEEQPVLVSEQEKQPVLVSERQPAQQEKQLVLVSQQGASNS